MSKIYDKPFTFLEKLEDKFVRTIEKNGVLLIFVLIGFLSMFAMEDANANIKVDNISHISISK